MLSQIEARRISAVEEREGRWAALRIHVEFVHEALAVYLKFKRRINYPPLHDVVHR